MKDGTACRTTRVSAIRRASLLLAALTLTACGSDDKAGEFYTLWDLDGGCNSTRPGAVRRDAKDRIVEVCDLADSRWIWVTYAAPWCSASRKQAPAVNRLTRTGRRDFDVFVVLTSRDEVFTPASRNHASAWTGAYGFAPGRVLYESEDGTRTLPQHLLIGPDGRTWYRYIGYLDTNEMQRLLDDFASGARTPNVRELP
ncbi:MAG: hypothetical protein WD928_05535 [Gammaproteobacteria bacterium]